MGTSYGPYVMYILSQLMQKRQAAESMPQADGAGGPAPEAGAAGRPESVQNAGPGQAVPAAASSAEQLFDYDETGAAWHRETNLELLKQFCRACMVEYDIPVGICHPLYPICCPWEQEVVDGITDAQLTECFSLAAERNRSIEIHACLYRNGTELDAEGISPSYIRLLTAAKKCGCRFHFGSDAHAPGSFTGTHAKLERAAQRSGITESDLWEVGR